MSQLIISPGRCQFCQAQSESERIVAGDSAFICESCIARCNELLGARGAAGERAETADRYVHQRVARHFAPTPLNEIQATSRNYPLRQQADLQLALDEIFG